MREVPLFILHFGEGAALGWLIVKWYFYRRDRRLEVQNIVECGVGPGVDTCEAEGAGWVQGGVQ